MRTAAAVAALVVTLGAVGCSADEAEPSTLPSVGSASASPSAPASPAAAALVLPENARAATVEGASSFARHYVDLIGAAFSTADATALRSATLPGCEGCEAIIGAVESLRPSGQRRVGGGYSVTDVATPAFENGDVVLLLTYTRAASEIVDAAGKVVDSAPAVPPTTAQMRLLHRRGRWFVQGYRVV